MYSCKTSLNIYKNNYSQYISVCADSAEGLSRYSARLNLDLLALLILSCSSRMSRASSARSAVNWVWVQQIRCLKFICLDCESYDVLTSRESHELGAATRPSYVSKMKVPRPYHVCYILVYIRTYICPIFRCACDEYISRTYEYL